MIENQRLAAAGVRVLLPSSRGAIVTRNPGLRATSLFVALGRGFGSRVERASRAVRLPSE
ncbi:hypothetical protein ACRCUN_29685 [Mycobacterium sp. LTG2003]